MTRLHNNDRIDAFLRRCCQTLTIPPTTSHHLLDKNFATVYTIVCKCIYFVNLTLFSTVFVNDDDVAYYGETASGIYLFIFNKVMTSVSLNYFRCELIKKSISFLKSLAF